MRSFSTQQLAAPENWPRHRLVKVLKALSHPLFGKLTIVSDTLVWQNMLLGMAVEVALPCNYIEVSGVKAEAGADVCLCVGALPELRTLSIMNSYRPPYHSVDITHPDAAKSLVCITPAVVRLASKFPFAALQHLTVSFLDVDMSQDGCGVFFPALETLTLARRLRFYEMAIDQRVTGQVHHVEPFGLHASMSDPAYAHHVARHFPRLAKLTVSFLEIKTWALPYRAPHDPSLPAPPPTMPICAVPDLQLDYAVATSQLPALVACCGATLTHLTLEHVYMPFTLETAHTPSDNDAEARSVLAWLASLTRMRQHREAVHYFTAESPVALPSFTHVCRLALRPGHSLVSVHITCSKSVPYFICMQPTSPLSSSSSSKPEQQADENECVVLNSSPAPTKVHIEWTKPERYSSYGNRDEWYMGSEADVFSFGVDDQCIGLDVQLVSHHVTRGLALVSSCQWTSTDALVTSFCRPRDSPSEWFATPFAFAQRITCMRTLNVTFPHKGMAGLFADRALFLRLGQLEHLESLTLAVEQKEEGGSTVSCPVVTLDSTSLPSLAHIHTTHFSVHWTGAPSSQLTTLHVAHGGCRSHVAGEEEEEEENVTLALVDLALLKSVFISQVPVLSVSARNSEPQRPLKPADAAAVTVSSRLEVSGCPAIIKFQLVGDGNSVVCATFHSCQMLANLVLSRMFASNLSLDSCPSLAVVLLMDNVIEVPAPHTAQAPTVVHGVASWCLSTYTTTHCAQRLVSVCGKMGTKLVAQLDEQAPNIHEVTLDRKKVAVAGAKRRWYHKQLVPSAHAALKNQGRWGTCQKGAPEGFRILRHRHAVHYAHLPFLCSNPAPTSLFSRLNFTLPERTVMTTTTTTAIHVHMTGRRETWDRHYERYAFTDDQVPHSDTDAVATQEDESDSVDDDDDDDED
jgi:hypothetical protein